MPISDVRRQVYLLTTEDLTEHSIWEFCSDEESADGQDEATVRPASETEVPGYSPGAYVVVADVTFADGTSAIGYLYSGQPNNFGCIQPNVITSSGQINFWLGALQFLENVETKIARHYLVLGKGTELIFPLSFQSRAKVNGSLVRVKVEGFMAKAQNGELTLLR
jgi:hypothetical protein